MSEENKVSILLVEDQLTQAVLMQHQLKKAGFAVKLARSGAAALTELEQAQYSLVLTDINMPQMNGYELTKSIKTNYPSLPVVLLATPVEHSEILKAVECGADNIVYKAYDEENFIARLRDIIDTLEARSQLHLEVDSISVVYRTEKSELLTNAFRSSDLLISAFDMFLFSSRKQDLSNELCQ